VRPAHRRKAGRRPAWDGLLVEQGELTGPQDISTRNRVLAEVARVLGSGGVQFVGGTSKGESKSTFTVVAGAEELMVKLVRNSPSAMEDQRRLVRVVNNLRSRGYPAPEYLAAGEADGAVFTVQRLLPGKTLEPGHGLAPEQDLLSELLPDLLAAVELQAGAGDLAEPPWPKWLLTTIETGGDGYCLLETMRQAEGTALLPKRLQDLARRNCDVPARRSDIVHFDMSPANILHDGRRLSGVVDWNIPFSGACQGDRGFDVATLLFYSYDLPASREMLWDHVVRTSGMAWTTVYLCHLSLRQVEWVRRHYPGSAAEARFTGIAWTVLDDCEARGA
jgi:aminoglycoside phosphotransferase (APT) family kinase protein